MGEDRRRWSEKYPAVYPLAVEVHRLGRRVRWLVQDLRSAPPVARERRPDDLPVRVVRHRSRSGPT